MAKWVGIGLLVTLGLSVGFVIWISTGGGERWVESRIEGLVTGTMSEGSLEIGGLGIDARSGLVARRVVLRDGAGNAVVRLDQLTIDARPAALLSKRVSLPVARVEGLRIDLEADEAGVLNLSRLFGPSAPPSDEPWAGLPIEIGLDEVDLRGVTITYSTPSGLAFALAGAHGRAGIHGKEDRIAVSGIELVGQLSTPGPLVARVSGDVVYSGSQGITLSGTELVVPHGALAVQGRISDTLELEADVGPVALRAFDPMLGDLGLGGRWEGSLSVTGTPDQPVASARLYGLGESRGEVAIAASADLTGDEPTWEAVADLADVHVSDVMVELETEVELGGRLDLKGRGLSWPDGLSATGHWTGGRQVFAGQQVDSIDAYVSLADGVLEIDERTVLEGILGSLSVSGELSLEDGPMDVRVRGTIEPERLAQLGAVGFQTTGRVDARVRGDIKNLDQPIRAYGNVRYAPFRYDGGVVISRLEADFDAKVVGGDVDGTATLRGSGVAASAVQASRLTSQPLTFRVRPEGTRVDGKLQLTEVNVDPVASVGAIGVDLDVDLTGDGMRVDANMGLEDWTLAGRPGGDSGYGRVLLVDDDVDFQVVLYDGTRLTLDTVGSYELEASKVAVSQFAWAPTPRTIWRAVEPWELTLSDGGVTDAKLVVASDLGTATVRGALGTTGELDGTVRVEGFQLDHLAELYPDRLDSMSGTLALGLKVTGDASDPTIDGTVDLDGLWFGESVRWLDVAGRFAIDHGMLVPELELGVAGQGLGYLEGIIPVRADLSDPALLPRQDATLSLALMPGSFERLAQLAPAAEDAELPVGVFSAMIESFGPLVDPQLHVAGVGEIEVDGMARTARVEFDLDRKDAAMAFWTELRTNYAQRATIAGKGETRLGEVFAWALDDGPEPELDDLELYLDGMDISGVLMGLPAATLVAMSERSMSVRGELVGGVSVTGSPTRPVVQGGVHWIDAEVGGEALNAASLSVVHTDTGYQTDVQVGFDKGGGLAVSGNVPLVVDLDKDFEGWESGELDLDITGEGVPLSLASAFDPGVRNAKGVVAIDGHIGGTLTQPLPAVSAHIEDASAVYTPLGLTFSNFDLDVQADQDRVVIERFEVAAVPSKKLRAGSGLDLEGNSPRVLITGEAALVDWKPGEMRAEVAFRDGAWLSATNDASVRIEGDLQVVGEWPKLAVDGDLEVVYGKFVLDTAALSSAAPLAPAPALTIVRGEAVQRRTPVLEPPLYADFVVDVNLDLRRNVELKVAMPFIDNLGALGAAVTRVDLEARLGGDLDIALRNGEPTLEGEVDLLEGKVGVLRSAFKLQEGTLFFSGGDVTEPNLDVRAEMSITDASLQMDISGTPSRPDFKLSSEEYPDTTEQMTILLTGRAPEELTSDQGAGTAEALAGLLFNSVLGNESLGTLSIEPDGTVRMGVPVSNRVYATTRLRPTTDPTENSLAVQLEWSVLRRLVLDTELGDRTASADVYWELRF